MNVFSLYLCTNKVVESLERLFSLTAYRITQK